jgi:hypothetical protein
MDIETIKKYVGKKVLLILKNNFQYTVVIPDFHGSSFTVKDKFGDEVEISCDFISFIKGGGQ